MMEKHWLLRVEANTNTLALIVEFVPFTRTSLDTYKPDYKEQQHSCKQTHLTHPCKTHPYAIARTGIPEMS